MCAEERWGHAEPPFYERNQGTDPEPDLRALSGAQRSRGGDPPVRWKGRTSRRHLAAHSFTLHGAPPAFGHPPAPVRPKAGPTEHCLQQEEYPEAGCAHLPVLRAQRGGADDDRPRGPQGPRRGHRGGGRGGGGPGLAFWGGETSAGG